MSSKCLEIPWLENKTPLHNADAIRRGCPVPKVYRPACGNFFPFSFRHSSSIYPTCVSKRVTLTRDNIWRSVCGCLIFDSIWLSFQFFLLVTCFVFFALIFCSFHFIFLATAITFVLVLFRSTARIYTAPLMITSLSFYMHFNNKTDVYNQQQPSVCVRTRRHPSAISSSS